MNDHELLREYVGGSQDAFARLVERHLPLVYSTARRRMADAQLAQDVAQQVFAILARKARGMRPEVILSGWLYRASAHVAARTLRDELRRRRREQLAMTHMNPEPPQETWSQIEGELDHAMATLGELDRDAVVLRFFEQKSLKEVGNALGTTEDAAQKRLSRAVEKLRDFYGKRGRALTVGSLTAAIASGAIQPVPGALAALVTANVVAGTAATTSSLAILSFMSISTVKIAMGVGITLAISSAVILERRVSRVRGENDFLRQQVRVAESKQEELVGRLSRDTNQPAVETNDAEWRRLSAQAVSLRTQLAELRRRAARTVRKADGTAASILATEDAGGSGEVRSQAKAMELLKMHKSILNFATNHPAAAFRGADGELNPEVTRLIPRLDWDDLEMNIPDGRALMALSETNAEEIIAIQRTPILMENGGWMRGYLLANGSSMSLYTLFPTDIYRTRREMPGRFKLEP